MHEKLGCDSIQLFTSDDSFLHYVRIGANVISEKLRQWGDTHPTCKIINIKRVHDELFIYYDQHADIGTPPTQWP